MKKSINLYCNTELNTKEKLIKIKNAGYDEFFTGFYTKDETLTLKQQVKFAKKLGLSCTMIHCQYFEDNLNSFWEENKFGDRICKEYIRQIKYCKHLSKNFVVHLHNSCDAKQTRIGLTRIEKILKVCEKYDLNLCIENLNLEEEIIYIFSNISHKNLKICYDVGHQNFLTPNFNIYKNLAKFIEVLHIHENNGLKDEHKILTPNSKVFNNLKNNLHKLKKDIVLSCEVKRLPNNLTPLLKQNLETLKILETN